MADLTFRSTLTGARPAFEYAEERRRRAVQSSDGEPQRRHRQINERHVRTFRLRWDDAGEEQAEFVRLMHEQTFGGVLAMNYTPMRDVDANAIEVVFTDGKLQIERSGPKTYAMDLELEEVL